MESKWPAGRAWAQRPPTPPSSQDPPVHFFSYWIVLSLFISRNTYLFCKLLHISPDLRLVLSHALGILGWGKVPDLVPSYLSLYLMVWGDLFFLSPSCPFADILDPVTKTWVSPSLKHFRSCVFSTPCRNEPACSIYHKSVWRYKCPVFYLWVLCG